MFLISISFNSYTLGIIAEVEFSEEQLSDMNFNMLTTLGFTNDEIDKANTFAAAP